MLRTTNYTVEIAHKSNAIVALQVDDAPVLVISMFFSSFLKHTGILCTITLTTVVFATV